MRKLALIFVILLPLTLPAQPYVSDPDYVCIWHCSGAADSSQFGNRLVAAGDQNDDGFDDILVSNYGTGEVYLYHGGNPMDTIPDMVFTEDHANSFETFPLELRDLNGDAFPDIVIAADAYNHTEHQKVYVYFGGPGLDNQADLIMESDSLGDNDYFGKCMSMGDINGDNQYDLIITDTGYDILDYMSGRIYIYFGGVGADNIPDFSFTADGNQFYDFSHDLSCSGDVNNDGFDDIVCRGRLGGDEGRMLFLGSDPPDSTIDWSLQQPYGSTWRLTTNSLIIPDINNDSYDEIVLGGDLFGAYGFFFYGGTNISSNWDVELIGDGDMSGIKSAGDLNNDGYGDLLMGNYWGGGEIYIFLLHPNLEYWTMYDIIVDYPEIGERNSMGIAGDVNDDQIDDFIFRSFQNNGEVFIYSNTSLAVVNGPSQRLIPPGFALHQNYPNPFNAQTVIRFEIAKNSDIDLAIFNISGQRVWGLGSGFWEAGTHSVVWNAEGVASGVYLVRLSVDGQVPAAESRHHTSVRKVVLVK